MLEPSVDCLYWTGEQETIVSVWLRVLLLLRVYFISSLSEIETFQLFFQRKAPISPCIEQGLIVLQLSDERTEFIFISSLFLPPHSLLVNQPLMLPLKFHQR